MHRRITGILVIFAVLFVTVVPGGRPTHAAAVGTYTMTDLGNLDRGNAEYEQLEAVGINDRGQVIGNTFSVMPGAFLWQEGVMTDLSAFLSDGSFTAVAINDRGQVIGRGNTQATGNVDHAFLYRDGVMIDLGTLGGPTSAAHAINASGQVVGVADTADGLSHAFLYSDGTMIDLGTLGGFFSAAHAINASGQVVGVAAIANGLNHAFLFDPSLADMTPPVISPLPANRTVNATSPSGAAVAYTSPTATDTVDGPVAVDCQPASNTTFPIGDTVVTCTATDLAGNSARVTFIITVKSAASQITALIALINGFSPPPPGKSLQKKLEAIQADLPASCPKFSPFLKEAAAVLTAGQFNQVEAAVTQIRAAAGCP
jgi:probable HAF family extracellular repeat protein